MQRLDLFCSLGFFNAPGAEEAAEMPVKIRLEKADGAVFGVRDAMAALAALAARLANHAHKDMIAYTREEG